MELLFVQHRWYYETDIKLHDDSFQFNLMSETDIIELEYATQQARFKQSPITKVQLSHNREVDLIANNQKNKGTGKIRRVRLTEAVVDPKIERVEGPAPAHYFPSAPTDQSAATTTAVSKLAATSC
jgi:hypothetical protein